MPPIIALSRPGYNWNDPDHSHLIFHSSDNCPKVFAKGSVTGVANHSYTVAHSLGFVPFAQVMQKDGSGNFTAVAVRVDATNIYFTLQQTIGYYRIGYEGSM